jgi:hypothetical protein
MPSTKKAPGRSPIRPTATNTATKTASAHLEQSDRAIGRIGESLAAAQKDLTAIGDSLGSGAGDLRRDVTKLLRDARRDVTKMSKLVRRDLAHLQKDIGAVSGARPRRARPGSTRTKPGGAARAGRGSAKAKV